MFVGILLSCLIESRECQAQARVFTSFDECATINQMFLDNYTPPPGVIVSLRCINFGEVAQLID